MHTIQQALSINTGVCDLVGKFAFPDQIRCPGQTLYDATFAEIVCPA
jgi:hypothetical protein